MAWFVLVCQFLLWLNAVPWFQWSPPCARRDTSAALIAPVCLDDAVMEEWTAETTQTKTNVVISLDLKIFASCCPSTKTFICVFTCTWEIIHLLFVFLFISEKKNWHHFDMKITVLDNIWDIYLHNVDIISCVPVTFNWLSGWHCLCLIPGVQSAPTDVDVSPSRDDNYVVIIRWRAPASGGVNPVLGL